MPSRSSSADSYDVANNAALKGGEVVSFWVTAHTTYYVVVDGFNQDISGTFQLVLNLASGKACSDPIPVPLWPGSPMTLHGDSTHGGISTFGSCGGVGGNDVVYKVMRQEAGAARCYFVLHRFRRVLYADRRVEAESLRARCHASGDERWSSLPRRPARQPTSGPIPAT